MVQDKRKKKKVLIYEEEKSPGNQEITEITCLME